MACQVECVGVCSSQFTYAARGRVGTCARMLGKSALSVVIRRKGARNSKEGARPVLFPHSMPHLASRRQITHRGTRMTLFTLRLVLPSFRCSKGT